MPRVSVVMPSYNHEAFVAQAIESVLCQTYQDFEIVITDDASQDRSVEVIQSIKDPRIKLKSSPVNRGGAGTMNDTILRSQGEYICVLNTDDVFLPHKIELQLRYLESHPEVGAVFSRCGFIDEGGSPIAPDAIGAGVSFLGRLFDVNYSKQAEFLRHFFYNGNCLCHPSVMIRRKCYEKVGLYDERLAQLPDLDMWMRVAPHFPIHVMAQPLMFYRILNNGKNACALRVDSVVRLEWEGEQILRTFVDLPDQLFQEVFGAEIAALGLDSSQDRRLALGKICLASNRLLLQRFGLGLLHNYLPPYRDLDSVANGFTAMNLIQETGRRDVFNTLSLYKIAQLEQNIQQLQAQHARTAGARV